jgi:2-dehydro-3-deoxygluconokinase
MSRADILLPSRDDLAELWGEADPEVLLDHCRASRSVEVVLTLGAAGCLASPRGTAPVLLPSARAPAPVRALDTAGAGDAFDGAYLAARLKGRSPTDAARLGLERAALAVTHSGALPMEIFP